MSKTRHELTDKQWEQLEPWLPPQKPRTGRTNLDHRPVLNGLLWIRKTGAPWRDLPARYGTWETIASRCYRWQKNGTWDQILAALQRLKDRDGPLDWAIHDLDGTLICAHQHAARAQKVGQKRKHEAAVGGIWDQSASAR